MNLFTLPDRLDYKKQYCKSVGILFTFINTSSVMQNDEKPYFNILLDDRAGLSASYNILLTTLKELNLWDLK